MLPYYIFSGAGHYQRRRLSELLSIFPSALLADNTELIAQILPETFSLLGYRTGGIVALAQARLAMEQGELAEVTAYCEQAIHTGLPSASLAAITRLLLAKSAHLQGQETIARHHLKLAFAQAESPATPSVIAEYTQCNRIPLPSPDE